jgi:hypothetical protein
MSESSLWSSFGYVKGKNLVHMCWSDKICVWTQFCFVVSIILDFLSSVFHTYTHTYTDTYITRKYLYIISYYCSSAVKCDRILRGFIWTWISCIHFFGAVVSIMYSATSPNYLYMTWKFKSLLLVACVK